MVLVSEVKSILLVWSEWKSISSEQNDLCC